MVLILLGNFAHSASLKFEVFAIISLNIGLVSSAMEHDTRELFLSPSTWLQLPWWKIARDVYFKSGLYYVYTRQNIVFKALGRFGSFLKLYMHIQSETFISVITSHEKQTAKYQTEMLSRIAKTAILVQEVKLQVKFPAKKNTLKL